MREFFVGLLWLNLVYHVAVMMSTSYLWDKMVTFNLFHANLWFNLYVSVSIYKLKNMIKQDYITITSLLVCNFLFYFFQTKVIPEETIVFRIGFNELNLDISTWAMSHNFIMNVLYLLVIGSAGIYALSIFTLKSRADIEVEKSKKEDLAQRKKTATFIQYRNSGDDSEHELRNL